MNFFNNYKKSSDEELMELVKMGKEKAFEEIYNRYNRKMHFYFFRLLNQNQDLADDYLQDLFMKLIEKPHLYNSSQKFSTWFYAVASNMCKNHYRKEVNRLNIIQNEFKATETSNEYDTLLNELDIERFRKLLHIHLDDLELEQKEIFVLRFQEELSIKEISEIVGCPEGTVKSRIFYTLKKLAKGLSEFKV